jgi:hypothetical protein
LTAGEVQERQLDLLPLLDRAKRVLVYGASESGKTELLCHVASRSAGVIIVDPHYKPGKWPAGRVIGKERNFDEIVRFLAWLDEELSRRSSLLAQGREDFQEITVIIDELSTIKMHCGQAAIKPLAMMIMESAKFGFRIFIGGHSKLVESLGLRGMGDIREGLLFVHLEYDQLSGDRRFFVDLGQGKQACYFPPFVRSVVPDLILSPEPTCGNPECDNPVSDKQTYCSNACRQKAYRIRH